MDLSVITSELRGLCVVIVVLVRDFIGCLCIEMAEIVGDTSLSALIIIMDHD